MIEKNRELAIRPLGANRNSVVTALSLYKNAADAKHELKSSEKTSLSAGVFIANKLAREA